MPRKSARSESLLITTSLNHSLVKAEMRHLIVVFEDSEFDELLEKKGKTPWRAFLLELVRGEVK